MALQLARSPLLRPVAALAGWTFVMEAWMYATRLPALTKYNLSSEPGELPHELEAKVPIESRAAGHNYNHLHEQPTVFYAVALSLALVGDNHKYTEYAAWTYFGVRVVHSLFQTLIRKPIMSRLYIFSTSSLVLVGLTGRLARLVY